MYFREPRLVFRQRRGFCGFQRRQCGFSGSVGGSVGVDGVVSGKFRAGGEREQRFQAGGEREEVGQGFRMRAASEISNFFKLINTTTSIFYG